MSPAIQRASAWSSTCANTCRRISSFVNWCHAVLRRQTRLPLGSPLLPALHRTPPRKPTSTSPHRSSSEWMANFARTVTVRRRGVVVITCLLAAAVVGAGACADINTDPKLVASIAMDTLPYPSIVAHDSLRDSLGIAQPLRGAVYNIEGTPLASIPIRFRTPDSGATVDSVRGYVVADTARTTPVRLFVAVGLLQAAPDTI